uniref:Uncharacterized protein n=1 Tax=Candidatus Kentrum sp. FM TaxID=2126340 RepID=A0A450RXH6_9GAMM|nr:MAG: hypothetical protein BECKFM1743A_GA0114220_1000335 [Candidatus Kentron sp. FM]VFJ43717.1 MAG: hypothetical protein BECKFM1743C_GA0114222_1000335 [Candidatus Kentron sp. FM]VFK05698.1 MAG: hypothetical protein BECKFM1743B_GA0114221_1000335 [Candidatus Kentron sp. FM]
MDGGRSMMQDYHYDPVSMTFTHATDARSYTSGEGETAYMNPPAKATRTTPPETGKHEVARYDNKGKSWETVANYIGTRYWLSDGTVHTITEYGVAPPDEAIFEERPSKHHVWDKESGQWIISLDTARAEAEVKITAFASDARAQVTGTRDGLKVSGWVRKAERAMRKIAGTTSADDETALQLECDARGKGETTAELANKQIAKAGALDMAIATIDGMEAEALERIKMAQSVEELEATKEALKQQAETAVTALLTATAGATGT